MSISKVHLGPKQGQIDGEKYVSQEQEVEPQVLLEDLKTKQALYEKLKREGLINQDKHLAMEQKLRETIAELEILIPQLEEA